MILNLERFFNLKNSLSQFILLMLTITALAIWDAHSTAPRVWFHLASMVIISAGLIYFLREIRAMVSLNPLNFFISSMIIFLLIHPTEPLFLLITALSILATEKIVRGKNMTMFNPAALALIITYWISVILQKMGLLRDSLLISWWGVDFNQQFLTDIPLLNFLVPAALLLGAIYFSSNYKKTMLTGMFFMTVMACVYFQNISYTHSSVETIEYLMASLFNAFAFLTFVMIPEPKTSPSFMKQQVFVGTIGGFLFYFLTFVFTSVPNGFLMTILTMNLLTYSLKRSKMLQS